MEENNSEISILIDHLLKKAAESAFAEKHDYTDETIINLEKLKKWKAFWSIEIQHKDLESLNRMGNVFGGLPFTSEQYQWPVNDLGKPYMPLVQISLDEVSLLSGQDFGHGLLQVWLDINDSDLPSVLRVIERSDLNAPLTLPSFDCSTANVTDHWENICANFSIASGGFMCTDFDAYLIESRTGRELTDDEFEVIERLMEIVEKNNFRCPTGDWLLGYPDKGSGVAADRKLSHF